MKRLDFYLQPWCRLSRPFLVEDPDARGPGPYTAGDWGRIRRAQTAPLLPDEDRYASDEAYRRYLASIRQSKLLAAESLLRAFDFSGYGRVLELGCGDMPQAYVVSSAHPRLAYTATDFDPDVIAACTRLPMLARIQKSVLDVTRDDLDALRHADLVLSWSLEFSLDDRQLAALFAACARQRRPYLLCTHADVGPIGYVSRARAESKLKRSGAARLRAIGWLRSSREVARLAGSAGMALRSRTFHVNHAALLFVPA